MDNFVGKIKDVMFWTNSEIMLCWVKSNKIKDTFVQNRVKEIERKSSENRWGHVKSEKTPADLNCLLQMSEQGPVWLVGSRERPAYEVQINDMEEKEVAIMGHCMPCLRRAIMKKNVLICAGSALTLRH